MQVLTHSMLCVAHVIPDSEQIHTHTHSSSLAIASTQLLALSLFLAPEDFPCLALNLDIH